MAIKVLNFVAFVIKDGDFLDGCKNAKEMRNFCIKKTNENGMPKFLAWLFTRGIPRLNRWST